MKDHLIFDTTNATTIADTDSVGAFVRSGNNGKLITHHTITADTYEALDVYAAMAAGDGTPITQTGGSLNVNLTNTLPVDVDGIYSGGNTNPDNVGVIAHTRGATPVDADQIERTTAALANADNVVAANVHGLDVNSFGMIYDTAGGNWDRMTGTGGNLNVNITNTAAVTVTDAALANISLVSNTETGAAATISKDVVAAPLVDRKYLWIYNNDNQKIWIGGTGVTVADGFPISPGSYMELRAGSAVDVEFVSSKASHLIRTLELK